MIHLYTRPVKKAFVKSVAVCAIISFLVNSSLPGYAQALAPSMPMSGVLGTLLVPGIQFNPVMLRAIEIDPVDPFHFGFIVDSGDTQMEGEELTQEAKKLIRYFLASLTTPEEDMWVNLSPYEADRIIPDSFGQTQMGRDLLAQDYILKQLTASLIYPEDELGQQFWQRIYQKAYEQYGTTEIPVDTFNKVWIMPKKASVYEHNNRVFVIDSELDVMMEEDFLASQVAREQYLVSSKQNQSLDTNDQMLATNSFSDISSAILRDIIIPEIKKEVNVGEHFANLRQIYHAMILAAWYKNNLKESLLGQMYVDKRKIEGIRLADSGQRIADSNNKDLNAKRSTLNASDASQNLTPEQIYDQYLETFKQGVYNFIKVEHDQYSGKNLPRKYFSGGYTPEMSGSGGKTTLMGGGVDRATVDEANKALSKPSGKVTHFDAKTRPAGPSDSATTSASAIKVAFQGDLNIWDYADALMDKVGGLLETNDNGKVFLEVGNELVLRGSSRNIEDGELLTVVFSVDEDRYRVTLNRAGQYIETKCFKFPEVGFEVLDPTMKSFAVQVLEEMSQTSSVIKTAGSKRYPNVITRPMDGAETNSAMISSTLTKTNFFKTVELLDSLAQQEGWDVSSIEPFVVDKSVDKTFDEVFDSHDAFHSSELMEIVDEENLISELNGVFITFKNSNGYEERARVHFYQRVNGQFTVSVTPHQSIKKQLDIVALREFSSPTELSYVLGKAEQQPVLIDLAQAVSSGISMNRQQLNAVMQRIVRDENLDVLRVGFKTSDGTYDTFSPSNRRAPWLDLSLHAHYTYVTIVLADNSVYHFNADKRSGGKVVYRKENRPFVESVASKVALKIKPGILPKGTIIDYEKMLNDMMEANGWRRNIEIKPRTSRILSVQHLQSLLRHSAVFMMMDSGRVVDAEAVQQWINTDVNPVVYRFSFSDDSVLYLLEKGEVAPVRAPAQSPISGSGFLRPQARDPQRTKPQTGKVAEQKKETPQEVLRLNDYEFRVYPNRVELWDAEGLNELSRMSIPQLSEQDNEEKQKLLNSFLTRYLEKKTGLSQDPETLTVSRSTPLDLYEIIKNLRSQTDKRVTLVKVSRSRSQPMQSYRPNNFSDLKGTLVQNMSFVRISFSDRTSVEINIAEKKDFRELRIRGNELIQEEKKWSSDTITAKALKRAARDVINAMRSVFSEQSKQTVKDVLSVESDRPVVQAQSQESAPSMFDREKKPKTEQRGFLPEDSKKVQRDIQELVSVVDSPQGLKTIEIFGFDNQYRGYNALEGAQIEDCIDAFRERFGEEIKTMGFLTENSNIILSFEKNTAKVTEVSVFDKTFRQHEKADLQRLQLSAENFLSTVPEEKKAEVQSEASKPAQDIPFNPNITERKESISFKGGVFDIKKFADEVVRKADGTLTINPRSSNGVTVFVFTSRNKLNYRDIHKPSVVSYVVTLKEIGEGVEVKAEFQSFGADMNHDEGLLRLATDILKSMRWESGVVDAPQATSEKSRKTEPAKLSELSAEQFKNQLFAFIDQLGFGDFMAISIYAGKFQNWYSNKEEFEKVISPALNGLVSEKSDEQSIEILWGSGGVRINLANGEVRSVLNKHPWTNPNDDDKIAQARQNLKPGHFLSKVNDARGVLPKDPQKVQDDVAELVEALGFGLPTRFLLHTSFGSSAWSGFRTVQELEDKVSLAYDSFPGYCFPKLEIFFVKKKLIIEFNRDRTLKEVTLEDEEGISPEFMNDVRAQLPKENFFSTAKLEVSEETVKSRPSADKRNIMDLSETEIKDHLLSFLGALNQSKPKERKLHFKTGFNRVAGQFFYAKSNIRTPERINFSITAELNNGEEIIFKVKEGKILSVWSGLYNRDASREEIDKARSMLLSDNFLSTASNDGQAAAKADQNASEKSILDMTAEEVDRDLFEFVDALLEDPVDFKDLYFLVPAATDRLYTTDRESSDTGNALKIIRLGNVNDFSINISTMGGEEVEIYVKDGKVVSIKPAENNEDIQQGEITFALSKLSQGNFLKAVASSGLSVDFPNDLNVDAYKLADWLSAQMQRKYDDLRVSLNNQYISKDQSVSFDLGDVLEIGFTAELGHQKIILSREKKAILIDAEYLSVYETNYFSDARAPGQVAELLKKVSSGKVIVPAAERPVTEFGEQLKMAIEGKEQKSSRALYVPGYDMQNYVDGLVRHLEKERGYQLFDPDHPSVFVLDENDNLVTYAIGQIRTFGADNMVGKINAVYLDLGNDRVGGEIRLLFNPEAPYLEVEVPHFTGANKAEVQAFVEAYIKENPLEALRSSSGLKKVENHVVGYRPDPNDRARDRIVEPQTPKPSPVLKPLSNVGYDPDTGEKIIGGKYDDVDQKPGGIIMGTSSVELDIRRDGNGVPLPLVQQPVELMNTLGFTFDIIGITVVPNLLLLSGLGGSDTENSLSQRIGEVMAEPMVADKRSGRIDI